MSTPVTVPAVGESITEGILTEWLKADGEAVQADEPLFVLETDKVTMTINAAAAGRLKIAVQAGETVKIGQEVGSLDEKAAGEAPPAPARPQAPPAPEALAESRPGAALPPPAESPAGRAPSPAGTPSSASFPVPQTTGAPMVTPAGLAQFREKITAQSEFGTLSPAVRRMVEEFKLDPAAIPGTGKEGRITKEDVQKYLSGSRPGAAAPQPTALQPQPGAVVGQAPPPAAALADRSEAEVASRQTRTRMSPLRARIAERLVLVKNQTAMLTTFNEADMTQVMALRERYKEVFQAKYGIPLGFMSFFVKAAVDALKAVPQVNAQIQGDEIVQNHYYDIGVAVSSEKGLVVPVVRDADRLSFAEVELAIAALAKRVRERTITLGELSGGVFTVSNGGIYGNLLSTPILNPPQSAILGMHAIKKRPVVVDDAIVIRPMMYLAVSYDHRIVDGREAVSFLKRVVQCIENPERLMLEI
ncbi:MAG: 2-oxoglutarate dehydrogenase complex dihydrolipoyllysine-residue succinyltransferase [Acidobacteriota bacterium]